MLSITEVRTVAERFDLKRATVTLRVEGHGPADTQVCLGYPWELAASNSANQAQLVIGSHGPCATEAISASNGESTDVALNVMTNGLDAGRFRMKFPVFLVGRREATRCGEAASPEFLLEVAPRVHLTP
jgi:hypothetical protein